MTIFHNTCSPVADKGVAGEIGPSEWNTFHTASTGPDGQILIRESTEDGRMKFTDTLRSVIGLSGSTNEAKNLRGKATFCATEDSKAIDFSTFEPTNSYFLVFGHRPVLGSPPGIITRYINPTTSGFTLEISAQPGIGNRIEVNWALLE